MLCQQLRILILKHNKMQKVTIFVSWLRVKAALVSSSFASIFSRFWGFYSLNFRPLPCKLRKTCRRMPSMAEPFIISLLRYFRLPSTSSVKHTLKMTLFLSEGLPVVLRYIICGYTEFIVYFVENLRKINQGNFSWAILRHFLVIHTKVLTERYKPDNGRFLLQAFGYGSPPM